MSAFLLLWLEVQLQSWAPPVETESRASRRNSGDFPTRSGVLGMVFAALGAAGEQRDALSRFTPLRQIAVAYMREGGRPADAPDELQDFQTMGGGYCRDDPVGKWRIPKDTISGKAGEFGKIMWKYYLQDVSFSIVLETPGDMAAKIADALISPVFDVCLGRACCIPSDFIYRGAFPSLIEALKAGGEIAAGKNLGARYQVTGDSAATAPEVERLVVRDVPVSFGVKKEYSARTVVKTPL